MIPIPDVSAYFKMLRISDWIGYVLIALAGLALSPGINSSAVSLAAFALSLFFYFGFSFSINNCFDVKEDKLHGKKNNPVALGKLPLKCAIWFSASLALLGIACSWFLGSNAMIFFIAMIAISHFYSAPMLRFKNRFIIDIISHGLFFGSMIFLYPFAVFGSLNINSLLLALPIFLFSLLLELRNHVNDHKGDKKAGLRTTACVLGTEKTKILMNFIMLGLPFSALPVLVSTGMYMILVALSLAFYAALIFFKDQRIPDFYIAAIYLSIIIGAIV